MPNYTKNLGLTKPLPEEFYDVNIRNENWDKVDAMYGYMEKALGVVNEDDFYAWVEKQTTGGTFLIAPDRTTTNVPLIDWYIGHLDYNVSGKRITMTGLNSYRMWMNATRENIFSGWVEIPTTNKNIVLNVPTNRGYRIHNTDTGTGSDFMAGSGYSVMRIMDTFDNNDSYREVMLVGANQSPNIANSLRLLDVSKGQGVSYEIYHEGNLDLSKLGSAGLTPASVE